jgi:hypothetical protein
MSRIYAERTAAISTESLKMNQKASIDIPFALETNVTEQTAEANICLGHSLGIEKRIRRCVFS